MQTGESESETGELDHHTSNNTISENLSDVNNSMDIPNVVDVGVDIPTNNTCVKLPKHQNVVEIQPKEIEVVCDFCPFVSTWVKELHLNLPEVHAKTYGDLCTYSLTCSERILPKVSSKQTVEQPRRRIVKHQSTWEEMCKVLDLLPKSRSQPK